MACRGNFYKSNTKSYSCLPVSLILHLQMDSPHTSPSVTCTMSKGQRRISTFISQAPPLFISFLNVWLGWGDLLSPSLSLTPGVTSTICLRDPLSLFTRQWTPGLVYKTKNPDISLTSLRSLFLRPFTDYKICNTGDSTPAMTGRRMKIFMSTVMI